MGRRVAKGGPTSLLFTWRIYMIASLRERRRFRGAVHAVAMVLRYYS